MLLGTDLSSFQTDIDWGVVERVGLLDFAIVKATQGVHYTNPLYAQQRQGARVSGLVVGSYHYAEAAINSGHAEAAYFLQHAGTLEPGDFLALDLEYGLNADEPIDPHADLAAFTLDFLRTVEKAVKFRPLLYSSVSYLRDHKCLGHPDTLGQYGLWLADYQTKRVPVAPDGWQFWAIWQYTGSGVMPGFGGNIDLNVGNLASKEQLQAYGRPR